MPMNPFMMEYDMDKICKISLFHFNFFQVSMN